MTLTMSDIGTWLILAGAAVFVVYLAVALQGMRFGTLRIIGGGLVVLALAVVLMQLAYVRWRLRSVELVSMATPTLSDQGPSCAGMLRTYAISIDAVVGRSLTPDPVIDTAYSVTCTSGKPPPSDRRARYVDVRRIACARGVGGADALRADVLSGSIRHIAAANDTWRITAVDEAVARSVMPTHHEAFWCFDLALVTRPGAAALMSDGADCSVPDIIVPFSKLGRTATSLTAYLDTLLKGDGTVALQVWGYGWQH